MSVMKKMNELFATDGFTPKQYVDIARIKAARVQRRKDYPLTKAEKAVVNEMERDLAKHNERMKKFAPQTHKEPEPEPEVKEVEVPKKKTTKSRRKPSVKKAKSEV